MEKMLLWYYSLLLALQPPVGISAFISYDFCPILGHAIGSVRMRSVSERLLIVHSDYTNRRSLLLVDRASSKSPPSPPISSCWFYNTPYAQVYSRIFKPAIYYYSRIEPDGDQFPFSISSVYSFNFFFFINLEVPFKKLFCESFLFGIYILRKSSIFFFQSACADGLLWCYAR